MRSESPEVKYSTSSGEVSAKIGDYAGASGYVEDNVLYILDIWVSFKKSNKGLGSLMLQAMAERVGATEVRALGVDPGAEGFWEALGIEYEIGPEDRYHQDLTP